MCARRAPLSSLRSAVLLACACAAFLLAVPARIPAQPVIVLEPDTLDYGIVYQQVKNRRDVIVRNAGDAPLLIQEIKTTCGCTVVEMENEEIAPAASVPLTIIFNGKLTQGKQVKRIRVLTNDPVTPEATIVIKVDVRTHLTVEPKNRRIGFGRLPRGETPTRQVHLRTESEPRLEIEPTMYNHDLFEVTVEPDPEGDLQHAILTVRVKPDAPHGEHREFIRLDTGLALQPDLIIELFVNVVQDIVLNRYHVDFDYVRPDQYLHQHLRVHILRDDLSFQITGVEIDLAGFTATVEEKTPGKIYMVDLKGRPLPEMDPVLQANQGRMKGTVRIFTDHPDQPELTAKVTYILKI